MKNEERTVNHLPPIEISLTKDMSDKMKLDLSKTENIEPDINHWYAKIIVLNRKWYVVATNTKTRFALIFKLNPKTFAEDFMFSLRYELEKYELPIDIALDRNIILTLGNNRSSAAQLSRVGQEIEYLFEYREFKAYDGDYADLFHAYNKSNLGTAGNNKEMAFAVDEMRKYL